MEGKEWVMKKLISGMILMAFICLTPAMVMSDEMAKTAAKKEPTAEDWGKGFFEYMGGVFQFPVNVCDKATRTLLNMDHHD